VRESNPQTLERIIDSADECDLSTAVLSEQLSSIGLEGQGGTFTATIDKLGLRQLVEVVTTVLQANGYALNLENILACIEQLRLAARVRLTAKSATEHPPKAKWFSPCIRFDLPVKGRIGPLLSKFYAEIDAYESEIARLQVREGKLEDRTARQLKKEIEQLNKENDGLRQKLAEVSRELALLRRDHTDLSQAFESQKLLPKNVRSATVIKLNFLSRHIELKSDSKFFQVPLASLHGVPQQGQACLVSVVDGQVEGVFFHAEASTPLDVRMAKVLFIEDDVCKMRDESRRNWLLNAVNPVERDLTHQLQRGDRVLLYFYNEHIVRFVPCSKSNVKQFTRNVQEAIARMDIDPIPIPALDVKPAKDTAPEGG
jgi:hypothetical protein